MNESRPQTVFEDVIHCLAVLACSFKYANQNFDADQYDLELETLELQCFWGRKTYMHPVRNHKVWISMVRGKVKIFQIDVGPLPAASGSPSICP